MELLQDVDAHLLKLPWQTLHIGDCSFFTKVHFTDSSYCVLVSDLRGAWCEEAAADIIQERSKELNKRLKAPISSFLSHLSQLIRPLLDSKERTPNTSSCTRTQGTLMLHVKSQLCGLPFYWDFHCKEASVSTVCRHFLQPLIAMTKALDSQCQELCTLLRRKDEEIQDYQEGGAVLSRDRLKTETFDENSFYKYFMSKNIPEQSAPSGLGERLQQLYSDVIVVQEQQEPESAGAGDGARPRSEQSLEGNSRMTDPAQQDVDDGQTQKPPQEPPDDVLTLTQRPSVVVSKAKKRKAKGLFK
ncbi:non-homologous end-joining factor 1 [Bufo bufo]|uniref:non-homologous end-joining factor 1 n=1 Tax=Bufo bufo TaxID=8384 RepID=UPI001ABDAB36|nr:non-homologous end-joining factor 1 [Bufo bufo]XP_040296044.1 non-homologous end-joining factor 1 [Bufo bufo]